MLFRRHLVYSLLGTDPNLRIDRFPDGQQNVVITNAEVLKKEANTVNIMSRLNSFLDLELILCLRESIVLVDPTITISLTVPYLLGARSDRKFEEGGNNYLNIIMEILDDCNFEFIEVLDVHNPQAEAFQNINTPILNVTLSYPRIINSVQSILHKYCTENNKNLMIQAPDRGAEERASILWKDLTLPEDTALQLPPLKKERKSGDIKISGLPHIADPQKTFVLIVDDICDGGGTFIKTAQAYKEQYPEIKLGLFVTHGIFSKGFSELQKFYEFVITTNSYQDFGESYFNSVKEVNLKGFLHQINIF